MNWVVSVGLDGSWFSSCLTMRLRKSVEERLLEEDDEDVLEDDVVAAVVDVALETVVMTNALLHAVA